MHSWMRVVVVIAVGGVVGCGHSALEGGGPDASASDARAADGAGAVDAAPDATVVTPRCDVTKPFGTPTPLTDINSTGKDIQAMLADDLTIYWSSDRGGNLDVYYATRSSPTAAFGAGSAVAAIDTAGAESGSYLTADELTMYYVYVPAAASNGDIYVSTRTATSAAFGAGTAVTALNSGSDDGDPTVVGDGSLMYFSSNRAGGTGGYDIYMSSRDEVTGFATPTLVTELDTTAYDAHPRVTADGLTIYYSSMRTDGGALAGADIWTAARTSRTSPFGTPTRVAELSTASNESPTWISADGCLIYLQSDRAGGAGGQDIWQAIKPL